MRVFWAVILIFILAGFTRSFPVFNVPAPTTRTNSAATDTLAASDFGNIVIEDNPSGVTVALPSFTLPTPSGATMAPPVTMKPLILGGGSGGATLVPTDLTIDGKSSFAIAPSQFILLQRAGGVWHVTPTQALTQ